jgi:xylan 1,4-beta-xylosidase
MSFLRPKIHFCWVALFFSTGGFLAPALPAQTANASETIEIDAHAPSHPFPHFWEKMFGSGRAILSLRESYRSDLRETKRATGFEYVRFHAILHDEVGVYDENADGRSVYNFSYVDQIYDGLLANGVKPFVELSFMPRKLTSNPKALHPFWYKQNVAPPKDWTKWEALIEQFARHVVTRYGEDEVAEWFFEVWNEPNIDFWAGDPKETTYFQLYDHTARALKKVSEHLRVGGPSTAQAAWVDRMIAHAAAESVPLDFVSTHVYGNDAAKDVFGTDENIPRSQMVCRAVKMVHDQIRNSARPGLPLIWSEFNASYANEPDVTDTSYMGPWMADTIRQCDGLVNIMSYWTFSDVFEEQGIVQQPFYGGFGLFAAGHIPKPAFNAFALLHHLGDVRLEAQSDSVLVTRGANGSLVLAVWNLSPPGESGAAKEFVLHFDNLIGKQVAAVTILDRDHGSPLPAYQEMGRPQYPTPAQLEQLRKSAALPTPSVRSFSNGELPVDLQPQGLALIELK